MIDFSTHPDYAKAYDIAAKVHATQYRTNTSIPYITHPVAVANILLKYDRPKEEVILGLLHDTREDLKVDNSMYLYKAIMNLDEEIRQSFGDDMVTDLVSVSKASRPEDGNRAKRVSIDIFHYSLGSGRAHNVKIADMMHNLTSEVFDKKFMSKYVREKDLVLKAFKEAGRADVTMMNDLRVLIDDLLTRY